MGNRITPAGGTRFSYSLLAFVLVASLVQVVSVAPAQAVAGDTGPAIVPGASTSALDGGQWETKNQHRIWWNAGTSSWDAVLPTSAGWRIATGVIPASPGVAPAYHAILPGFNDVDRPDIFWDEANSRLYVLVSGGTTTLHTYNEAGGGYTLDTTSTVGSMEPDQGRVAIYKTPSGNLWASMMTEDGLFVSRSVNDGVTWQGPVKLHNPVAEGQTQLAHFDVGGVSQIAIAAAEDGDNDQVSTYLFYRIADNNVNWDAVTFAVGTFNFTVQPTAGDAITIGGKSYFFRNAVGLPNADGNVAIGATITETRNNLVAAVNLDDDFEGTGYAAAMTGNAFVSMVGAGGQNTVITARRNGPVGNTITLVSSNPANPVSGPTLLGGASEWTYEQMPLSSVSGLTHSDDELSLVRNTNGDVYVATETQRSTDGTSTQTRQDPQVIVFRRLQSTGAWSEHVVKNDDSTSTTDRKRPVVAILDQTIYVIAVNNPQDNSSYRSAPLSTMNFGSQAYNAAWEPLFASPFEFHRNNIVPREPTTGATKLPVLVDWSWDAAGDDTNIWQTSLPNSRNQAPGVHAGLNKIVDRATPTNLDGIVLDNDVLTTDNPIANLWTVVSAPLGGGVGFSNATSAQSTATFSMLGVYVLRLTATETGPNPLTNFDDVTVTVVGVNTAPSLTVTNPKNGDTAVAGAPVTFSASATDPESGNISGDIRWTSSRDGFLGLGGFFQKLNLSTGTHIITATVSDGQTSVSSPGITLTIGAGGGGGGGGGGGQPPVVGGADKTVLHNPTTGTWRYTSGAEFFFGDPGDYGFMGDWNCDGIDTPGLYRRSDGYVYLRNTNTQGIADVSFFFGDPGDLPMAGDFNGNGCDTVSIYRPSEGKFYIINALGSADGGLGAADFSYFYGDPGDQPFMGDFNGDGIDTPGLRRDSTGFVYLRFSNTQGVADVDYFYGDAGDFVFTGDWDANGTDTLGLYRPANGTVYLRNSNDTGVAHFTFQMGGSDHRPVAGRH